MCHIMTWSNLLVLMTAQPQSSSPGMRYWCWMCSCSRYLEETTQNGYFSKRLKSKNHFYSHLKNSLVCTKMSLAM